MVFEAGYFIGTKGPRNALIVRVGNAKMPADLGGAIYLGLQAREDVSHIQAKLQQFIEALGDGDGGVCVFVVVVEVVVSSNSCGGEGDGLRLCFDLVDVRLWGMEAW